MLTVTDAAAARLHEMAECGPEGKTLRLEQEGTRLGFVWDEKKPGDKAIAHDGATVLVCDEQTAGKLSGRTMDVKQTAEGPALMLT